MKKQKTDVISYFDDIPNASKNINTAIRLPAELNYMGLPFDFPRDLLDEMPVDNDGVIIIDIAHPGIKAYFKKKREEFEAMITPETTQAKP